MELHTFPIGKSHQGIPTAAGRCAEAKDLAGEAFRDCPCLVGLVGQGGRPHSGGNAGFEYIARRFDNLREESKAKARARPCFQRLAYLAYRKPFRPSDKHQLDRLSLISITATFVI